MLFRYTALALFLFIISLSAVSQPARHYDVLITEFLSDPSPSVGLPSSSFIELKNVSGFTFNLRNWSISNGNTKATIKKDYLLQADSFLILCPASAADDYHIYGATLGLSGFPPLNHDDGKIILSAEEGTVIHAIQYDKSWYKNELKSEGGWSLEMIDPGNPCTGFANWSASEGIDGGTPGKTNAVHAESPDTEGPDLLLSITQDSLHIIVLFSEPLDSVSAADPAHYSLSPDIGSPLDARPIPPFYDRVVLTLKQALMPEKVYTLSAQQVTDCRANEITTRNSCKVGLAEQPLSQDLVFNEILFNPPPYGFDFVELYNRSRKIIDLQQVFLAGKDALGALKDPRRLVSESSLFFPGEYAVLTENKAWILNQYPAAHAERIIQMSALPSMPDDQGRIILLNESGMVLDELSYDHHWHFPLLADEEGVSLERIQADKPTALASNWTSAASTEGFGTPTNKNSESFADAAGEEMISVEPKIFSPDNDGYQDFCFFKYHLPQGGFTGNIWIYDINGRAVKRLANNSTLGVSGSLRWDGLGDVQNPLPMGHYVMYAELFLLNGTVKKYKAVIVLARKR